MVAEWTRRSISGGNYLKLLAEGYQKGIFKGGNGG